MQGLGSSVLRLEGPTGKFCKFQSYTHRNTKLRNKFLTSPKIIFQNLVFRHVAT